VSYRVVLDDRAKRQLKHCPDDVQAHILDKLKSLVENPRPAGVKALQGVRHSGLRIRVGKYRVLYTVNAQQAEVIVFAIGPREDVYKQMRK
jgi:mRNA interferase RelE/StbE